MLDSECVHFGKAMNLAAVLLFEDIKNHADVQQIQLMDGIKTTLIQRQVAVMNGKIPLPPFVVIVPMISARVNDVDL